MKQYRPAQRTGAPSANRIRERYLHQLGLQRGSQPQGPLAAPTHQVVVIGLPSLPEERATNVPTNLQLESHDFSNYQNTGDASHYTADSDMGDSKALSGDGESDSGSSNMRSRGHSPTICMGNELNVPITSLALSYPTALLKPPPEIAHATQSRGRGNPIARFFSMGGSSIDDLKPQHVPDQGSVTSTATSTTAGSSFTMVSRDWGSAANAEPMGVESSTSSTSALQGVHYRDNLRSRAHTTPQCVTSSLAHALNRFNIDSDCEASIASGSIVGCGNSIMTEDEDHVMDEDDTSVHSHTSFISMESHRSNVSSTPRLRGRKAGKAQRLMDRAAAHERILQIRSEQSQKTRASLVHLQRMGHQDLPETRSRSNSTSSQNSLPLLHVQHGSTSQAQAASMGPPQPRSPHAGDLSRTPTVSNCSDLKKLRDLQAPTGLAYPGLNRFIPAGVHVSSQEGNSKPQSSHMDVGMPGMPLLFHPQLASAIPPHAPHLAAADTTEDVQLSSISSISVHESLAHRRQSSVEDVLEVVEALSKLKGKGKGSMIPRVR
ncbi:hypothetical protein ACHAXN_006860 [Cyclotella atomus]